MATPTIIAVTPARGHTGGQTLVEITGTNFKLPGAPPADGIAPATPQTVQVLFGTVPATAVGVAGADLIYCKSPIHDPGIVGVTVKNLDANGVPIVGESVTKANAFTFERPDLTQEGPLAAAVRALMVELDRQVLHNVALATHSDYDESTGDYLNLAMVAKLPAIVLANIKLHEDRTASPANEEYDVGGGRYIERRAPVIYDIEMVLVGAAEDPILLFNLSEAVRIFFRKNTKLATPRDPANPSTGGTVSYDLDFTSNEDVAVSMVGTNMNVSSFTGAVVIHQVRVEDMPGVSATKPAGIPAAYPHEATTSFGWTDDAESLSVQRR